MDQVQVPNNLKRVLSFSFILILISVLTVLIVGYSLKRVHTEIQELTAFNASAKDLSKNFEKNLQMYTSNTQSIIEYLLSLRPETESEYIEFISHVEEIGQTQKLKLDLQSNESEEGLKYRISFFGTEKQMNQFLKALEALPYFVKVEEIDFKNPEFLEKEDGDGDRGNIVIAIKLHTK